MFKKLKGTVHMPPMPRRGMDVHSWCEAVFKALKQVRSMGVDMPAARPSSLAQKLPFTISAGTNNTGNPTITASPGVVDIDAYDETVETSPASGTWRFYASAVINTSTGAITSTNVEWSSTTKTNTSTTFYLEVGRITVTSGVPDASSIAQLTFGPILVIPHGSTSLVWQAVLI